MCGSVRIGLEQLVRLVVADVGELESRLPPGKFTLNRDVPFVDQRIAEVCRNRRGTRWAQATEDVAREAARDAIAASAGEVRIGLEIRRRVVRSRLADALNGTDSPRFGLPPWFSSPP